MEFNTKCMHRMYHMASSHLQSIRTAHRLFKPHIRSNVRLRNTTIIIYDISTPLSYVMQSMLCLISCYLTGCAVAIQRCSGRQEGASRTRCCCKPRRLLSHGILRRLNTSVTVAPRTTLQQQLSHAADRDQHLFISTQTHASPLRAVQADCFPPT